ncbi:hypothetical protein PM082_019609 [Marasmius tenuissimus]|nr:hypothetical protein PM082_019609 [Marasmius tenuissimus]
MWTHRTLGWRPGAPLCSVLSRESLRVQVSGLPPARSTPRKSELNCNGTRFSYPPASESLSSFTLRRPVSSAHAEKSRAICVMTVDVMFRVEEDNHKAGVDTASNSRSTGFHNDAKDLQSQTCRRLRLSAGNNSRIWTTKHVSSANGPPTPSTI